MVFLDLIGVLPFAAHNFPQDVQYDDVEEVVNFNRLVAKILFQVLTHPVGFSENAVIKVGLPCSQVPECSHHEPVAVPMSANILRRQKTRATHSG